MDILTDFLLLDSKVTPSKEQTSFSFMASVTICSDFRAQVRFRNGWLNQGPWSEDAAQCPGQWEGRRVGAVVQSTAGVNDKASARVHAKSRQPCPALCYPMHCSPPGSSASAANTNDQI